MKILAVIAHIGMGGGQVTQTMRILKELAKTNQVTLLTLKVESNLIKPPVRTIYAGRFSWPYGVYRLYRKIREIAGHYDVVQCFDGYYSLPSAVLARKKPYFLRMGMDAPSFLKEKGAPLPRFFGWIQMLPVQTHDCAKYVVNSENLRKVCESYDPLVIRNGYDLQEFKVKASKKALRKKLHLPQDKTLLLFTGKVIPRKNLEAVFEATRQTKDTHFVILGEYNPENQYYKKLVSENNDIDGRYTFVGEVAMDKVRQYLKACDIMVFPSTKEGSPNSVLEAMAAGMAIVCSDIPSHRDIINKHNGVLCRSQRCFNIAVKRLAKDEAKRKVMGKQAMHYVKKFHNIKDTAKAYLKLYKEHL